MKDTTIVGVAANGMDVIAVCAAVMTKGTSRTFGSAARAHDQVSLTRVSQVLPAILYVASTLDAGRLLAARIDREDLLTCDRLVEA